MFFFSVARSSVEEAAVGIHFQVLIVRIILQVSNMGLNPEQVSLTWVLLKEMELRSH